MNRVRTVLAVDDDPDELARTCRTLGSIYPVLSAASGEAALRTARATLPSVIVLDVMMSEGKDGFAVFSELNNDPATRDIPVIFLTNVNQSMGLSFGIAEFEKYLGSKPAAFLEKPVTAAELLRNVAKILDHRDRAG